MHRVALLSILILSSCSSIRSLGLKAGAPLFYDASSNVLDEKNFDNIDKGLPGNLMLLEGLRSVRPTDNYLTATVIKGYVGLAFAIDETKYLNDKYRDLDNSKFKNQAIYHYTKALRFGESFLRENNLSFKKLESALKDNKLNEIIDEELSSNDVNFNAIFFTAQALGSLINLQRDQMALIGRLPLAKGMFDWVCGKNPNFNNGACDIFYASYEATRPRMLGGSPEKGKVLFLNAIKKWPNNFLIREAYLEYYAIPMSDENAFNSQVRELEKYKKILLKSLSWKPNEKLDKSRGVGLYNSVAIKRFEIMQKYKKDLF